MTHQEVITALCRTVGMVYNTIGDYSQSSDCFCDVGKENKPFFSHSGETIQYIHDAVVEKLRRDGYKDIVE